MSSSSSAVVVRRRDALAFMLTHVEGYTDLSKDRALQRVWATVAELDVPPVTDSTYAPVAWVKHFVLSGNKPVLKVLWEKEYGKLVDADGDKKEAAPGVEQIVAADADADASEDLQSASVTNIMRDLNLGPSRIAPSVNAMNSAACASAHHGGVFQSPSEFHGGRGDALIQITPIVLTQDSSAN